MPKISFYRRLILTIPILFLVSCQSDLYTKLSENEANEIVALLTRSGITAHRAIEKDNTSTVRVDESSIPDAVAILNDAGLPRPKFATMGEVFADTKLISSPTEERARFIYALSQELSQTLSEIDGVISARVHLVLPKNDPLREDAKPSSASVFIKHDAAVPITSMLSQIKTLVTNSVEGLNYDKVSVVFVPSERNHRLSVTGSKTNVSSLADFSGPFEPFLLGIAAILAAILGAFVTLQYLRHKEDLDQIVSNWSGRSFGLKQSRKTDLPK